MSEKPTSALCKMVIDTRYEDLPGEVVTYTKNVILDVLGITIGGSSQDGIPAVVDLAREQGGNEQCLLPFYGGKIPASMAAFAVGPMTRALDMGDVHTMAGHCSEYLFPAMLAAAGLKDSVTGKEFITAYVVGSEVLIRIGEASRALTLIEMGIEHGGHYIFGAVSAVGKLLGLSLEQLQNAMGLAKAMTQPHDILMYSEACHVPRVHHGFVCQDAVNVCLLAQKGITGPHEVLLGPRGYLNLHDKAGSDPEKLTAGLGKDWRVTGTEMKPYASCKCTHTAISGIITILEENKLTVEEIKQIDLEEGSLNCGSVVYPKAEKWNPVTVAECQFSLPYAVATAALDKNVGVGSYTEDLRTRKRVRELMTRIAATEDKALPRWACRISVELKDGRKLAKEVLHVKGSVQKPFTKEDLIEKFKSMIPFSAYPLRDATVDALIASVLGFEKIDDVIKTIVLPLTPERT